MASDIDDRHMPGLSRVVRELSGRHFPESQWPDLKRAVRAASAELGFGDAASGVEVVLSRPLTKLQKEILVAHLTVGETFFFRDRKLFETLEKTVIPGLMEVGLEQGKVLRFWSAGCCSGEEPYSLAMVLDRMGLYAQGWSLLIRGTDINSRFLDKAARGEYTRWSLRDMPDDAVSRYFAPGDGKTFQLLPEIRCRVVFSWTNLVEGGYPSPLHDLDNMNLVFLRNVLMYMSPETQKQVLQRVVWTLADGGLLVVSPSEVGSIGHPNLCAIRQDGVVFFRKTATPVQAVEGVQTSRKRQPLLRRDEARRSLRPMERKRVLPSGEAQIRRGNVAGNASVVNSIKDAAVLDEARTLYEQGCYEGVLVHLSSGEGVVHQEQDAEKLALRARALANLGRLEEARACCLEAVSKAKLDPHPYYLLACICQEQGQPEEALEPLRKALYLDPGFVLAHLALANVAQRLERCGESQRHLGNVLSLLESRDDAELVPHGEGITVGKLVEVVQSMIGRERRA